MSVSLVAPMPDDHDDDELDLEAAAIDHCKTIKLDFGHWAGRTAEQRCVSLARVLGTRVLDPATGERAPVRLFDLLDAKNGRRTYRLLVRTLREEGMRESVISTHLRALRVFCLFLEDDHQLDDGTDLEDIFGPLACPVPACDWPTPRKANVPPLPGASGMHAIAEALVTEYIPSLDGRGRSRRGAAGRARSSFALLTPYLIGNRPTSEGVLLSLDDQRFDREGAKVVLSDSLCVRDSKKRGTKRWVPMGDRYLVSLLEWYLNEWRPKLAPDHTGPFFPKDGGAPVAPDTLRVAAEGPLVFLKRKGLLDPAFYPHAGRAAWATRELREHKDIPRLLRLGGWSSTAALVAYLGEELIEEALADPHAKPDKQASTDASTGTSAESDVDLDQAA